MTSDRRQAFTALVALAFVWGYTWVVVKVATHDGSPWFVAAGRTSIGCVVLAIALAATRRSFAPTPAGWTAAAGLLQTTGFILLQTLAVAAGGAGKTSILTYTMPFWVCLMAWPYLGERITRTRWIALGLAAAGLAFVLVPINAGTLAADVLAVAGGIVWAASAVVVKRFRSAHDVDLLRFTFWQMVWGMPPLIVLAAILPEHVTWTPSFVGAMIFIGVMSQALAWLLWLFILQRLPASVAGIASLATPVLGVGFAALQLHEIPPLTEITGMIFIVAALAVNSRPEGSIGRSSTSSE